VWLKVSFTTVVSRVKIDGTRPKFADSGQAEKLFGIREPFYRLARVHIETEDRSPVIIVDEIAGAIRAL